MQNHTANWNASGKVPFMNESPPPQDDDSDNGDRAKTLLALVFVALLVLGGLFLVHYLKKQSQLQDCFMQGRTNCAPIDQ
jgi:hypothetical protein